MKRHLFMAVALLASLPAAPVGTSIEIERPMKCPHCGEVCIRADSATWFCGSCRIPVAARPA